MSGEVAPDDDVADIYAYIEDHYPRWRDRKDEIKEASLGQTDDTENIIKKRVEKAIKIEQNHDDLLDSTITAFGPTSTIFDETGWKLLGTEPLYEVEPGLRNPDAIVGHSDRDTIVTIECKSGLSSPRNALEQIRAAADVVLDYANHLERKTGISFDSVERVLCVPGQKAWRAVEAIEAEEREDDPDEPIYLWKLNRFQNETLQLHQQFDTRSVLESAHESRLAEMLSGDGIAIADCPLLTPSFFPDSHPFTVMEHTFSEILWNRTGGNNGSIRKFTRSEIHNFINDQQNVPHYDTEIVADMLTEELLSKLLDFGLTEEADPSEEGMGSGVELYGYDEDKVSGQSMDTILTALKEEYQSELIDRKAERQAIEQTVEEFLDDQSSIDDY
ncbi:hypothetical protein [Haloarchaeobius sp. DT45]|uniref:hypothetical protein n=1 Tax=Haloarchaeobius sp. DT45 TaxID=3446116 RepID=UPI003F6C87F9